MSKQQVRIKRVPEDRPRLARALRLVGRMSLRQAQDLAIHLARFQNSIVVAGVDSSVAEHVANVLQGSGAEVDVEECSIDTPMLCSPEVNARYQWGAFRTIRKAI